jgi:NAD(P)-dependent dehydrogenase (short-subunit alcohol dehydrogenase family)
MRHVLITGAASGIGFGTAEHLELGGWRVTRTDLAASSGITSLDVTREADWQRILVERGPFDAVVNCAGVRTRSAITELSLDEWNRVLHINLTGSFLAIKHFARECRKRAAAGSLVNIASVNSFSAVPSQPHYVASKAAVAMLTKAAALELAPERIRVNAIAPGPIVTPMLAERLIEPGGREWLEEKVPIGRLGEPLDCARGIAFLLSEESSYITGVTLPIDGGWLTR